MCESLKDPGRSQKHNMEFMNRDFFFLMLKNSFNSHGFGVSSLHTSLNVSQTRQVFYIARFEVVGGQKYKSCSPVRKWTHPGGRRVGKLGSG